MNTKKIIKQKIIDNYNSNSSIKNKFDLNQKATDLENPFYDELNNDIVNSIKHKNEEEIIENKDKEKEKNQEDIKNEEIGLLYGEDDKIDKELLDIIESKMVKILNNLKIDYYKTNKDKLKQIIFIDFLRTYIPEDIPENIKKKIIEIINDMIDHEFNAYQSKKEYIKKELLKNFLHIILPEVDDFFKINNYHKLNGMTLFQQKNLIKYFIESIEQKYLLDDFYNNTISEDEYLFLKSKIKLYIKHRYDKTLHPDE